MAPAAQALNGDDTPPEILEVVAPEKVVPGERFQVSVTVRDNTFWLGTSDISTPDGGLPANRLDPSKYVPPVYHPDGSRTLAWTFIACDAPYGQYEGFRLWISDMHGNHVDTTLNPVTLNDPAHPIENAPTITGKHTVGSTLTGNIKAGPGAVTTYHWFARYVDTNAPSIMVPSWVYGMTLSLTSTTIFPDGTRRIRRTDTNPIGLGTLTPEPPMLGAAAFGSSAKAVYDHGSDTHVWGGMTTVVTQVQWLLNGVAANGATTDLFAPKLSDIGKNLQFRVTTHANAPSHTTEPIVQTSPARTIVAGTLKAPKPAIVSTAPAEKHPYVGRKLNAKAGSWTKGTTLSYQWTRDGKNIKGATKASYTPVPADAQMRIGVTETGKKPGYTANSATSATVKPILRTVSVPWLNVRGTQKAGYTVKAVLDPDNGSWARGTTITYQWYRAGKPIKGATKGTLKILRTDRGKTLQVSATGEKYRYTTASTKKTSFKIAR
ncbi:hypothetical protein [Paeniglutamicibacter sp.]|uniref:hypothetical protein n=1 Tax=Paeniglutamicibacter sp. TaxID=1934391 RepID=UPI0039891927